jgi:hypothetical protein
MFATNRAAAKRPTMTALRIGQLYYGYIDWSDAMKSEVA